MGNGKWGMGDGEGCEGFVRVGCGIGWGEVGGY